MSRHEQMSSLELLLDTMCNTFGGVMFIAIMLIMTINLYRHSYTPQKQLEAEKQALEAELDRQKMLEEEHRMLARRMQFLQERVRRTQPADAKLAETIVRLRQQRKMLLGNQTLTENTIRQIQREAQKKAEQNRKKEEEVRRLEKENVRTRRQQTAEENSIDAQLTARRTELHQTPVKRIHFAVNQKVSMRPYLCLVRKGMLYQMGDDFRHPGPGVAVRQEGRVLHLIPQTGIPLERVSRTEGMSLLRNFDPDRHFFWLITDSESFHEFVRFRRFLRERNWQVFWYVNPANVVYLGSAAYKAAH